MPWELGYFDGFMPGHVAILPLVKVPGAGSQGQEYLGLYPYVQDISFSDGTQGLGIFASKTTAWPIVEFAAQGI